MKTSRIVLTGVAGPLPEAASRRADGPVPNAREARPRAGDVGRRDLGRSAARWRAAARTWRAGVAAAALPPILLATAVVLSASASRSFQSTDPESQVRAAVVGTLEAWRKGDFEALAGHYGEDARGFFLQGSPLARGFNAAALQMAWDAGLRADVSVRDLDVQVHGDVAASVAYVDGTLTLPGGAPPISGTWRYSEVRTSSDGAWKVVQYHFSRLAETP